MSDKITRAAGLFFARALLGIIFLMQGYGKVFGFGVAKVYDLFFKDFEHTLLPKWLLWGTVYYTSYVELICGFLLMIGLLRQCSLFLLAANLLIVSFGHGLMEPIWDLQHVMPRAILLITLLLVPQRWDRWCLDRLIKQPKQNDNL
jgi:putative oxidoreductase